MPSPPSNNGAGWRGFQDPGTTGSDYSTLAFIIQAFINRLATITLVQVVAVTNNGGLSPVGFVDVHPLVNQIDGTGAAHPHGVIYKCPYFRLQGGANAIILDPKVGDIGLAAFADHDISSVTARAIDSGVDEKQGNPGSRRRFSMADALYLGGYLNGTPTQFVQFSPAGIRIHSTGLLQLDAPNILIHADAELVINADSAMTITTPTLTINGDIVTTGAIINNSVDIGSTHLHSGVSTGIQNTGPPIP